MKERLGYNLFACPIGEAPIITAGRSASCFILCGGAADAGYIDSLIGAGITDHSLCGGSSGKWADALKQHGCDPVIYPTPEEMCEELFLCLSMPMYIPRDYWIIYDDDAAYRRFAALLDNWTAVR